MENKGHPACVESVTLHFLISEMRCTEWCVY